ncbi:MAG: hypothetical protein ACLUNZ_12910 [Evtepia sp.]
MKRVLFIYNRHAGKNKTWAGLSNIINAMTERGLSRQPYPTRSTGRTPGRPSCAGARTLTRSWSLAATANLERGHRRGRDFERAAPPVGYIPVGTTE